MILTIKKALHKQKEDVCLSPIGNEFRIFVSSFRKGFYLYTEDGRQVGQVIFENGAATITAVDSSSMLVYACGGGIAVKKKTYSEEEKRSVQAAETQRIKSTEYFTQGEVKNYNYRIFEQEGKKSMEVAAIIPDISDESNYRVRIAETGNILKLLMVIISIDRLVEGG